VTCTCCLRLSACRSNQDTWPLCVLTVRHGRLHCREPRVLLQRVQTQVDWMISHPALRLCVIICLAPPLCLGPALACNCFARLHSLPERRRAAAAELALLLTRPAHTCPNIVCPAALLFGVPVAKVPRGHGRHERGRRDVHGIPPFCRQLGQVLAAGRLRGGGRSQLASRL
jgi:hypothetical protein